MVEVTIDRQDPLELSEAVRARAATIGQQLLAGRPMRVADHERENRALVTLIRQLGRSPADVLQELSRSVMELLGAGSAGVSLLRTPVGGNSTFWWAALVGAWGPFVDGEMPRHASPCGVVVDAKSAMLFEDPKQIFPAAGLLDPSITEVLLAPFYIDGKAVGTVWALHHDSARKFDREDARLLSSMAGLASAAHRIARVDADRQESQQRLESLAEALPNHVWTAGADGLLDWFNQRVYEFSGTAAPALNGQGWASIVHPDDLQTVAARWTEALATGETYETQFRLRAGDGSYRWHLARAVPLRGDDGAILRWIGTNTDIEEQKRFAQAILDMNATLEERVQERTAELVRAQEVLRQSQKMEAVGQLTGGIAHDFNNMLAVVIGALNLIERRQRDALPFDDLLAAAHDGARRAADLTHRLLAFSRQLPLDPRAIDVADMITSTAELIRRTLGEAIRIETVLADGLWMANTDANQLENALLNLSINARDAMPNGGQLTIETSNACFDAVAARGYDVAPGDYVLIAVRDTGTGMAPDVLEKAFDPFFTTKAVGKGTGLGLSQVFGYVKQSCGHIKIESQIGHGTTVKIYLPRAAPNAGINPVQSVGSVTPSGSAEEVILLVEDEDRMREISAAGLRELGYTVLHTSSAKHALEVLNDHPQISLLFTDIVMPEMGGRQLADAAIDLRPDLKVLFTTGYTRDAIVHDGVLDAGVHLLPKPFTLDQLGKKVREVLS